MIEFYYYYYYNVISDSIYMGSALSVEQVVVVFVGWVWRRVLA